MRKTTTWIMALLMLCAMTATVFAANPEKIQKERTEIEELSVKALQNLYAKVPSAEKEEVWLSSTTSSRSTRTSTSSTTLQSTRQSKRT